VGAPTSLLLGFTFGMQGFGIWLGLAVGLLVAAITLTARFVILSNKPLQREE
jgi:MATE family multidrug resistance protein